MTDPASLHDAIRDEMRTVLVGKDDLVEGLTVAVLTGGHVLVEGVPGVAKTTVANLFAEVTGLSYNRIQMTPDILPADITGTTIYREETGEFERREGPVFSNVVVADEINRATPKTQSALLEAMQEGTVSIDGETVPLPDPFIVIATQNPIEMEGTFELPEAQRDRFQQKLVADLPDHDEEMDMLDRFDSDPDLGPHAVEQVVDREGIETARDHVADVYVDRTVKEYVLAVVEATRESEDVEFGASPRVSLAFLDAGKARAAVRGRDYVIPDDVKALAEPILAHRIVLDTDAHLSDLSPADVVESVLDDVPAPSEGFSPTAEASETPAVGDGGVDQREDGESVDGTDEADDAAETGEAGPVEETGEVDD